MGAVYVHGRKGDQYIAVAACSCDFIFQFLLDADGTSFWFKEWLVLLLFLLVCYPVCVCFFFP